MEPFLGNDTKIMVRREWNTLNVWTIYLQEQCSFQ